MSTVDIFDDSIVGAGSAGIPSAARLSADPCRRVVLPEAGPDYRTVAETPRDLSDGNGMSLIHHDWGFTSDPTLMRPWRPEELTPVQ